MKKCLILISGILFFFITGCETVTEQRIPFELRELENKRVETCVDDCIDNEEDLKAQIQVMIDSLDDYIKENNYMEESCFKDLVSRNCFEDADNSKWTVYLKHKNFLLSLLEHDYEIVDGALQYSVMFDPCSGIRCPQMFYYNVYMNDTTLRIGGGNNWDVGSIRAYDYSDGLKFETYNIPTELYSSQRYEYFYEDDNNKLHILVYLKDGLVNTRFIEFKSYDEMVRYDEFLSINDAETHITKTYSKNDNLYRFSDNPSSWQHFLNNKYIELHTSDHFRDSEPKEVSSVGTVVFNLNVLLLEDWDRIELIENDEIDRGYYLFEGFERITDVSGFDFHIMMYDDHAEMQFIIKAKDLDDFIMFVDRELGLEGEISIQYMFDELNAFRENPESFLEPATLEIDTSEDFFKEFFGIGETKNST